jgi:hypothetical protein
MSIILSLVTPQLNHNVSKVFYDYILVHSWVFPIKRLRLFTPIIPLQLNTRFAELLVAEIIILQRFFVTDLAFYECAK